MDQLEIWGLPIVIKRRKPNNWVLQNLTSVLMQSTSIFDNPLEYKYN